jgi:hypothetical protein
LEVDDDAHPSTQTHRRNKKNSSKLMNEKSVKNTIKIMKKKNDPYNMRWDSRIKISYIERIKHLQGGEITTTSSHSLEDWRDLLHFLLSSLTPWSTPTALRKQLWLGVREGLWQNALGEGPIF